MMYNNKLACAIKVNGKVLREHDETVFLPFGSEYSFFIKNLHSRRVQVSITIDGEDIADGDTFVVRPNSSIDIERFLRNNNNNKGNRFKFIERTAGVEQHRGVSATDGLIRIEYQFEKEYPVIHHTPQQWNNDPFRKYPTYDNGDFMRGGMTVNAVYTGDAPIIGAVTTSSMSASVESPPMKKRQMIKSKSTLRSKSIPLNDVGVTVEGSVSDQKFNTVASFPLEDTKHVMVLKLLGETEDNQVIEEPITTKTKLNCPNCGRMSKAGVKFCAHCGTNMTAPPPPPPVCKTCGALDQPGALFCDQCGTSRTII